MRLLIAGLIGMIALPNVAQGQAVKSTVAAANGVVVDVYSDDFAARKEFTSPEVKAGDGQIMVATISKGGVASPIELSGFFVYSGEWRRYSNAVFKGGDVANFISTGRDVGRCSSSRYSRPSCTLSESSKIALTPADIRSHNIDGVVAIQIRADDTSAVIFEVPMAYFTAVADVAKINIDSPAAAAKSLPSANGVPAGGPKPAAPVARHTSKSSRHRSK